MSFPVFYVVEGDVLPIPFSSYDGATGASEAISGLAVTDIEIYKDTSTTQRASDNGYALTDTDGIDVDGAVGQNGFSVDLSDNSDASFYEVGPWYTVKIISITADTQTVNFIAAMFRIVSATRGLAGTALPAAAADAAGGLPISDAGGLDLDSKLANTHEVTAARMGALTDWINGGRLDLLLDAVLEDTGTTLQGELDGIQADTEDMQSRLPAALVGGRMDSSVGAMAANTVTAAATAADFLAEIQAEAEEALRTYHLDHLIQSADPGSIVADDSLLAKLVSKSATAAWTDFVNTTHSLQALRDRGDAAWITATGFSTHSAADVWAVATRVLTAGTNLNNISAADVLTQVNAAIDTAIAELGVAAPTATPTLRTGLMLLYMALRNKTTSTATETTISNNAGTTIATAAQSDDTVTYEKGEFA